MARIDVRFFIDLSGLLLGAQGVLYDGVDEDGGDGSEGGPDPVDDDVLDVGVALAAELEAGGQHGVVVTTGIVEGWKKKTNSYSSIKTG